MNRKNFLKNSLGLAGVAIGLPALLRSTTLSEVENIEAKVVPPCSVTNSETEGPFPTHTPSSLVLNNIVGDRTGVPFTINIYINNTNANCSAYQGVLVDIWHCDKDGNYSEYGGIPMQSANYVNYHFLRGRQTTDSNGLVSFTSIFPGWYQSRATHIHVHIYKADGTSLLVTQIAFPEGANSAVYNVNVNGSAYGYTKGMSGYTYNASDNVFSDGTSNEMSTVTGSLSAGYVLTHTIYVAGANLGTQEIGVNDKKYKIEDVYPNPIQDESILPIYFAETSDVDIDIYDMNGRLIKNYINQQRFSSGKQNIKLNKENLLKGIYILSIKIKNSKGEFKENKKIIVQ